MEAESSRFLARACQGEVMGLGELGLGSHQILDNAVTEDSAEGDR